MFSRMGKPERSYHYKNSSKLPSQVSVNVVNNLGLQKVCQVRILQQLKPRNLHKDAWCSEASLFHVWWQFTGGANEIVAQLPRDMNCVTISCNITPWNGGFRPAWPL